MTHKSSFTALAAALAVLPLAGCGIFSSSSTHDPHDYPDFKQTNLARVVWRTNVGDAAERNLAPAVTVTAVYAAGSNRVVRLDRQTGSIVWRTTTDGDVTAGVGTDGSHVAVGTSTGKVQVFDAEGKLSWEAKLSSDMEVPPLVGANRVIVKTSDTRITAFDLITGQRVWHYQGQAPALTLRAFSQMAWSPAGILVGQANGRLMALNPNDGRVVFDAVIGQAKGITEVERLIDVVGRPWVDQELMCAAAFQGNVVCMNVQNGRLVWNAKVDAVTGPVADGRLVYEVDDASRIHAFNRQNGREAWVNESFLYRSASAPIRVGTSLAFGDYEGNITFLDPATGTPVARTKLSGRRHHACGAVRLRRCLSDGRRRRGLCGRRSRLGIVRDSLQRAGAESTLANDNLFLSSAAQLTFMMVMSPPCGG